MPRHRHVSSYSFRQKEDFYPNNLSKISLLFSSFSQLQFFLKKKMFSKKKEKNVIQIRKKNSSQNSTIGTQKTHFHSNNIFTQIKN